MKERLQTEVPPAPAADSLTVLNLPESGEPVWQFPLVDEMTSRQIAEQARNYQFIYRSMMVPQVTRLGERMFVNWFGNCLALDLNNGKLLWRNGKSHEIVQQSRYYFMQHLFSGSFTILNDGERLLALGTGETGQNHQRSSGLAALDPETGKTLWNTRTREDLKAWRFIGQPILKNGLIYAVAQYNQDLNLYAIAPADGAIRWQLPLGLMEVNNRNRYYGGGGKVMPNPTLIHEDNRLYILTHYGAMIMVNPGERSVGWAYTYDPPSLNQNNYYRWNQNQNNPLYTVGRPIFADGTVYFKEAYGQRLHAIDTRARNPLWNRPAG
ncbi:MAG: PQQ-binding-like beta-propeller repeat protein, partial [Verrucomicrobiota bacterium]